MDRKQTGRGKLLLLIDINGTMCQRLNTRVNGDTAHDFRYKKYFVYRRPFIDELFDFLQDNSNFDVYVYTSMMDHNAKGMVQRLLPSRLHYLEKILDQSLNKPDVDAEYPNEFMRDLYKVWEELPAYSHLNTILVDNDEQKCREFKSNSIIIPNFIDDNLDRHPDSTLKKLIRFLKCLVAHGSDDVRKFIEKHSLDSFNTEEINPESLAKNTPHIEDGSTDTEAVKHRLEKVSPAHKPTESTEKKSDVVRGESKGKGCVFDEVFVHEDGEEAVEAEDESSGEEENLADCHQERDSSLDDIEKGVERLSVSR